MKKQKLIPSLLMIGLMMPSFASTLNVSASSSYGGGSGTESDPYLISTPEHLNQLQLDVGPNNLDTYGKYYRLTNNIDLSGYDNDNDPMNGNFTPIGDDFFYQENRPFQGVFDGNGYRISNLKIVLPNRSSVGLFGSIDSAEIKNLGLKDVLIEGENYVAGLVGYSVESSINHSYATGSVSGQENVGGLVGSKNQGTINHSYATGSVNGQSHVGGLVGSHMLGTINQSYAMSDVSGETYVGGLVGGHMLGTMSQSYATGHVTGNNKVGGLVGSFVYGTMSQSYATGSVEGSGDYIGGLTGVLITPEESLVTISECYAAGTVSGDGSYTGGLVGFITSNTDHASDDSFWNERESNEKIISTYIKNSYWDTEATRQNTSQGGIGLNTSQMIKEVAKTNMVGFDFDTVWRTTSSYPVLKWQPEETKEPSTNEKNVIVNGTVQTMVADVTIPSVSPDLVINPNLEEGYVSPEFSISNDSVSPIKLELKTFEQVTDTFNDVLPSKYESWIGLNKHQSQDIALGLVAKEGEGWQQLTTPTSYVANHTDHEIGIIKPTSSVDFSFDVKHGTAFSEAKTVQYKMVFVFDLMN